MPQVVIADIENDVGPVIVTGRKSSIGATALQLTTADTPASKGVLVKASAKNASGSYLYAGPSTITADSADSTDGFELSPGDAVTIPVDNVNKVYVIGSTTGLKAFWMVVN